MFAFLVTDQGLVFSGIIGSGLCVFSKHPIQEFTQHVFTLNGYPYMVSLLSDLFHHPPLTHGNRGSLGLAAGEGQKGVAVP